MANNDYESAKRAEYYEKQIKRIDASEKRRVNSLRVGFFTRLLGFIIVFLLCVGMYRVASGNSIPTFTDLLNLLQSTPPFQIPLIASTISESLAGADWGIANYFRTFLLGLAQSLDFIIWVVNCLIQVVQFLFHIIKWVFVF